VNYAYHLAIFVAIYALLAVGLNILVGYCGRLSLAHVVFFAVGGYAYAYGALRLGWSLAGGLLLAVVVVTPLSVAYVLASHARRGDEYVLVSLALQSLCYSIIFNWYDITRQFGTLTSFTNGPFGASGMPRPTWLGSSLARISLTTVGVCAVLIGLVACILVAPWGRALRAMRDDEALAQSLAKDVVRLHGEAVLVASVLASVAGVLYAMYVSYIDPAMCNLEQAVLVLSMVIVGGVGNIRGPIVGALLLVGLPEVLRFLHLTAEHIDSVRLMIYGGALTLAMHFRPQGIAGEYRLR
jgi:branched-chain amino acid transport system permease protein